MRSVIVPLHESQWTDGVAPKLQTERWFINAQIGEWANARGGTRRPLRRAGQTAARLVLACGPTRVDVGKEDTGGRNVEV